jgi:hypothetical protein
LGCLSFLSLIHISGATIASDKSIENILLKAGSETLSLEAHNFKPSYFLENLLNRIIPG